MAKQLKEGETLPFLLQCPTVQSILKIITSNTAGALKSICFQNPLSH